MNATDYPARLPPSSPARIVALGHASLMHGFALLAATTDALAPVTHVADVAREKDVVWLSLVTAIVALLFSAWLVRQMMAQSVASITAINALAQELLEARLHQFLAVKPDKEGLPKGNWYPLRPWWAA